MASLPTSLILSAFTLLIFFSKTSLASDPSSSFSFKSSGKGLSFESSFALFGDAKVAGNGSLVQLTGPLSSSAGRVMYKKPIKLVQGKTKEKASFSTYFSFSMSSGNGDGLAFFMSPIGFNGSVLVNGSFGLPQAKSKIRVFAVEFDTFKDNHVGIGIDLSSFVSVRAHIHNVSSAGNLVLSSGLNLKLHCWIDYEAASRRLDVRLSQDGRSRPVDSIVSFPIDVSKLWKHEEEVFVGLSSSNRNSSQACFVYSWSFKLRLVPKSMHSEPLDLKVIVDDDIKPNEEVHKRSGCASILQMLGSMVFASLGGALGAFVVLFLWTVFGSRRQVVPGEFGDRIHDYKCSKVKVVVDKAVEGKDGQK